MIAPLDIHALDIHALDIRATASPLGHRIDFEWVRPDPELPGMRIVRRRDDWPTSPDDGEVVMNEAVAPVVDPEGREVYRWSDAGLVGETVYYYLFIPFAGSPPDLDFHVDERNRASAMATAPYGYGERMAALLPAIYHRFDKTGFLRNFLDLTGSHLDQLHSLARGTLDLHDPEKVDGHLLPLLADWIGWPVDHRLGLREQRDEIRQAPHIYRTIGLVPTIESTVKRVLGLESRVKEMAHNVQLSNRPPRMNLWLAERDGSAPEVLSLNAAREGRPTATRDGDGTLWLFYHTRRKASQGGQWDIWLKTHTSGDGWSESQPLTDSPEIDKHPSAVLQRALKEGRSDTLWVFWDSWLEGEGSKKDTWRLGCRSLRDGVWSPRQALWSEDPGFGEVVERRRPQAVADDQGGLWLFWQERTGEEKVKGRWRVRYNRHDGTDWDPVTRDLRDPLEEDPRVEDDLFVFLDPSSRLWIFWARRDPSAGGRWRIAYRFKADLDPAVWNWGDVAQLPTSEPEANDREPMVVAGVKGQAELYWSSNRDRSWSIWRSVFDLSNPVWGSPEVLTSNPFSQRGPLVAGTAGEMLLYYSDESLAYTSATYRATRTVDHRYAGSTTLDARNVARTALRGSHGDVQTYTFDTGTGGRRGNENRYAHDTVALYVTPSSEDPSEVPRQRYVLQQVLQQFLPAQVRVVLVLEGE